ncbi:hypothetical protein [Zobellella taiwanensis]|uniref:Uncharacterized protein n=1 Tax=Zobellella taiwanensis TaxID=347535 RepID=A0A2P7QQ00_9GAMM|nr:hypothetical protein [Zobellella taiwanensis]PSJ40047.1 hypothetical protein C7I36_12285 [Zobellella taiwanensis]
MPWLSTLALLLYLSLLCSSPATVAGPSWLELTDQQAQLVNPPVGQTWLPPEQEGSDDHDSALAANNGQGLVPRQHGWSPISAAPSLHPCLTECQARAPPSSSRRQPDQPA